MTLFASKTNDSKNIIWILFWERVVL